MVAEKKPIETGEWKNTTLARLAERKQASRAHFDAALEGLNLNPKLAAQPALPFDESPAAHHASPKLAEEAQQQVLGVKEILARLGIGQPQAQETPARQDRFIVASVSGATLPHTPGMEVSEASQAKSA